MSIISPLLDVRDVTCSQAGRQRLAPVSFTLNAGERLHVTGPSGCGKSTLLKILASLLEPASGAIFFSGRPVSELKPEAYRQQVSWCSQTPALFGETVWDNLAFPWQIRQKRPERATLQRWLRRVNLADDLLDTPVTQLSGGEKQRVALLRNLQFLPQVLLLDEVTSALDEQNKRVIHQLIDELINQHGMAAVWVSHDPSEIAQASRLLALRPVGRQHESA
ncbi:MULTISPECIES: iron ABC transporter ATP-binding protein FetA [Erwinia]|uniref:iron efflux ABC transporter ATP-binding subunit FetA n=1 Tax=Erwinia TaxID=551 RepID=UPI0005565CF6|nr:MULTISPECIES: iron ABC transporter ATP-binding protein FetA [Erwinia]